MEVEGTEVLRSLCQPLLEYPSNATELLEVNVENVDVSISIDVVVRVDE